MVLSNLRFRFSHSQRLHGGRAFASVFDGRCRKHVGPVTVYGKPNGLGYSRLGLSVSRRVGNAVRRNRIKRLLREAFRLQQHDLPRGDGDSGGSGASGVSGGRDGLGGYDVVVVVRAHEPAKLADYQHWLAGAVRQVDKHWQRRAQPGKSDAPPGRHTGPDGAESDR